MAQSPPRYGTPNFEMLKTWFGRPPEQDGPFWALNLMKYREVADYTDDRDATISGREADDVYVPRDSLAAIGAMLVFGADVTRQAGASPAWDRIGIVRYPSRVAFLEMQQRDDFKRQHVHKDAGMDFTIVMSCLPDAIRPPVATPDGTMVLRVARVQPGSDLPEVDGAVRLATFDVEGVIIGDERTWTRVAFDVGSTADVLDALVEIPDDVDEMFAMTLGAPALDAIEQSIAAAAESGTR